MASVTPDKDCLLCGGAGHRIEVESDRMVFCTCVYWKRVGLRLGPEIAMAKLIQESILYQPAVDHGAPPVVDRTKNNLLLKGWWSALLSQFKWSFICKFNTVGLEGFSFQVITDEKLRNVWFGKESTQARTRKQRDEVVTFNTVEDLIGGNYSLAIIRLGFLGWKNQAMGGILKEALMVRQALRLPTWLVEEPDSPFMEGHYTWSRDVADYIRDRFEIVDIAGGGPTADDEPGLAVDDETPVAIETKRSPRPKPSPEPRVEREVVPMADDPVLTGGGWGGGKSFKKRKSGGGGPV